MSDINLTSCHQDLRKGGKIVSTEPGDQARCVTSPDLVSPHGHFSHTRRSKSGYWSGTVDIPELRKRPQSSYHGSRHPPSAERQLIGSPETVAPQEESVPIIKG